MSFWRNVESELQYKNMTRKELAERAGFAVSGMSLGLTHNSVPNADVAVRIAEVLGVSAEYLVTGMERNIPCKENADVIRHITADLRVLDRYDLESLSALVKRMSEKPKA